MTDQMQPTRARVDGTVAAGYEAVADAFGRNFAEHGDQGASVAVYVDGELKVDLWGGVADPATGRQWEADTIAIVYSATKGATAILCNLLAQRGELDLDAPVARYWPEFAANGKGTVTVRMLLSHQAGLPVIDAQLTRDELLAGTKVVEALAAQAPAWKPGTAHGYHALTYGWLLGEVVRRATGRRLGELFASEIAEPLGLDFFIGLPESEEPRVAPLVDAAPPDPAVLDQIADPAVKALVLEMVTKMMDPTSLLARALSSNGALPTPSGAAWNARAVHAAEQPAANGITNARSLARLYAACVSEVDGVRLLDQDTLDAATAERSSGPDELLVFPSRFGSGFMLMSPVSPLMSDSSFGHTGAGGALGFGDRDTRVGFGYVQNQLGGGPTGDPRTEGLIAAVRTAVAR